MLRPAAALLLLVLGTLGCARQPTVAKTPRGWLLMYPPQVEDPALPKGQRLLPEAPLADWREQAAFPSEEACTEAKRTDINRSIDHARAESGEANAKYDLAVRRAVHARCVPAVEVRSPASHD